MFLYISKILCLFRRRRRSAVQQFPTGQAGCESAGPFQNSLLVSLCLSLLCGVSRPVPGRYKLLTKTEININLSLRVPPCLSVSLCVSWCLQKTKSQLAPV